MFERYFDAHPIGEVRYMPQFPVFKDRAAWEGIAPADREALVAYAEKWHGQPFICGRSPVFPEQEVQEPYFLQAVIWDACFVRMGRFPEAAAEKKFQCSGLRRFLWNCRIRVHIILTL